MNYLSLFWGDYLNKNSDAYIEIENAKQYIANRFQYLQQQTYSTLEAEEKALLGNLYSLSNDKFQQHIISQLENPKLYGGILNEIDQMSIRLKEVMTQADNALAALKEVNNCVVLINRIINKTKGKITQGSIDIIKKIKEKAELLAISIYKNTSIGSSLTNNLKKELEKLQIDVASNVAGYALEAFYSLSATNARIYGNKNILEPIEKSFINSGAIINTSLLDPKIQTKLSKELALLGNQPTKSDAIQFFFNSENGTGSGQLKLDFESIQIKNYTDISNIGLGRFSSPTLGNLNQFDDDIWKIFNHNDELVLNAAAALGDAHKLTGINSGAINTMIKNRTEKGKIQCISQTSLAEQWDDIVRQAGMLGTIDAIVGKGTLNSAKYYVIRDKTLQQVKVISSKDIIANIGNEVHNSIRLRGFKAKQNNSKIAFSKRYEMTKINALNFVDTKDSDENDGKTRSKAAIPAIREKINNTKILISLNAMSFFK